MCEMQLNLKEHTLLENRVQINSFPGAIKLFSLDTSFLILFFDSSKGV